MEAAEEVHHAGPAGLRHGETRRRGADPGGGPVSGRGAPEDQRSAGRPSVVGPSLADWAGDSSHSTLPSSTSASVLLSS